jgi:hypothetical protein
MAMEVPPVLVAPPVPEPVTPPVAAAPPLPAPASNPPEPLPRASLSLLLLLQLISQKDEMKSKNLNV